jgi:hypothetical protein
MKQTHSNSHSYEFYFPRLDTNVLVEEIDGEVYVHATRNTFSRQRKACFIRELAAEGFIPDQYQWFSLADADSLMGVHWLVDFSWIKLDPATLKKTNQFMRRMFFSAAALWVVMVGGVILFH